MITRTRVQRAMYLLAAIAGLTLVLAACGGGSGAGGGDLAQTGWVLTDLGDEQASVLPPATIFFGDADDTGTGESFGSTGCNSFNGPYTTEGATIDLGPYATTLAGCVNPGLQQQETAYLAALGDATTYNVGDGTLEMSDSSGVILTFAGFEPELSGTAWQAIGINNGAGGVESVLPDTEVTAVFDAGIQLSGSGGCNNFASAYRVGEDYDVINGGSIELATISSTRKACDEPIMEQEQNYYTALENSSVYIMRGITLELRDASGALQIQFVFDG